MKGGVQDPLAGDAVSKQPICPSPHLKRLEAESIHIIREVAAEFENTVMLYSIGKDSSVILHLARKAFFPSKLPFPLCIAAFVAPSSWVRQKARELIGKERFFHVHLSTPADVCRSRDITGQYKAADNGEISNFPGVTFNYEIPTDADLVFDTQNMTAEQVAEAILPAIAQQSS